jgi:lysophospholipase L1-like esterase
MMLGLNGGLIADDQALVVDPRAVAAAPSSLFPVASRSRFADDIRAFEAADALKPPPVCATLFVGSSSIRFWHTLADDFPDRTVINRGFGGSTIAEANYFFGSIVAPYKPAQIVFYSGENDLTFRLTPAEAFEGFKEFMALKDAALGSTPVWFISAKPSRRRFDQIYRQQELNTLVRQMAEARDDLVYVDVVGPMMTQEGLPKDIFIEDGLHMTAEGYAIWTTVLKKALDTPATSSPFCAASRYLGH